MFARVAVYEIPGYRVEEAVGSCHADLPRVGRADEVEEHRPPMFSWWLDAMNDEEVFEKRRLIDGEHGWSAGERR